ncbi:uncharacterized protein LOC106473143 [Limulus polyphemus]|uniref:Uncharacterized protein LOC106473143 n=1 Tax=Limulus polyphemus TaxID=6850 RepID=A0ABM1TN85_LIMPO|nr:uncharacterized protein LOC106473143 [Limulus polyphemus]
MNSPAEKFGLGFLGSLKNSTEFLSLDRDYYHIGYNFVRGIRCNVWENVRTNVTIGGKTYRKVVLTYYFMTQWWKSFVSGVPENEKPVRYQITGYEKDDAEPTLKEQYNMFAFRDAGIDLKMFEKFSIEDCEFKDETEYFQILFEVDRNKVAIARMNDQLFRTYLLILLAANMGVSPIRLPFLRADYSDSSILVSVLLLEKPPSLTGFSLLNVDDFRIPRKTEKNAGRVENIDECAAKCLQEKSPLCKSIHYCDHQCFLNPKDISEEWGDPVGNYKNCDFYIRAVSNAAVFQVKNEEALKSLETSVNKSFTVRIMPPKSDNPVDYQATSVIRNSGYYRFKDETYDTVAEEYQLDKYSQTTRDLGNVGTRGDCYKRCREATSLACSSFSFCTTAKDRTCRISSVLIRKNNEKDKEELEANSHCEVYTRNYLMFYDKYEGKVFLTGGDKSVDGTRSPAECAKKCRSETEFRCRGFEYCEDKNSCVLHKKHVLDINPSNMVTAKATCSHYAAKFIADYLDMGRTLIDDKDSKVFSSLTLEECARMCSEQPELNCKSFNYCPSESEKDATYAECSLSSKTLASPGVKTKDSVKCQHFAMRDAVNDWGSIKRNQNDDKSTTSGYTGGGLAALLIGMLLLGVVFGICAFFTYSCYKSRKNQGTGMSVKFVNSGS